MLKRTVLIVAFVFAVVSPICIFAQSPAIEAGPPSEVQKGLIDDTVYVDKNKGAVISTTRELYVLTIGGPDCYFCKHIVEERPASVEGMFALIKGDPAPKAHYICQMKGRGHWVDVERECPSYATTARVCETPPGEFWMELIHRVYAEGDEYEFNMIGDVWSETVFTPRPGSSAKPEWSMVSRAGDPPQE